MSGTMAPFEESRTKAYESFDLLQIADHVLRWHVAELEVGSPAHIKGLVVFTLAVCKIMPHMASASPESRRRAKAWIHKHGFHDLDEAP